MARIPPRPPVPSSEGYELVWEGKYDDSGKRRPVAAPEGLALVLEEQYLAKVVSGPSTAGPPNLLLHGDNLQAATLLLPQFRGSVQLIYLDPPFGSDADYALTLSSGPRGPRTSTPAYGDRWSKGGSYLAFMAERLTAMRELLTESGTLFLHCDWHYHAPLRMLLDEIFGADHFINEIVWHYYNKYSRGRNCLPRAHDTILVYGKTRAPAVYPLRLPREKPQRQLLRVNEGGVLRNRKGADGKVMYRTVSDKKADDVWTIPQLQPASSEWTGYATQKHPQLLERILALGSKPGDLVADFFCGSGTTLTVAQAMQRRFIGCDEGTSAIHISRRRLLDKPHHAQLDVLGIRSTASRPHGDNGQLSSGRVAGPEVQGLTVRLSGDQYTLKVSLIDEAGSSKGKSSDPAEVMRLTDVDMWAVDSTWKPGQPFTPTWTATRKRGSSVRGAGNLALTSPLVPYKADTEILVRVWDRTGRLAEFLCPLPRGAN